MIMHWKKSRTACLLPLMISIALLVSFSVPQTASAEERISVDSKIANLRSGPGTENQVLWQVERFHPLIIVEKKGVWCRVKDFEGDTAWLHKSLISSTRSVITVKAKCNVRSGPGTDNPVIFTTERGVPFKVIKTKGNWLNIQHADGDTGWIHNSLVW